MSLVFSFRLAFNLNNDKRFSSPEICPHCKRVTAPKPCGYVSMNLDSDTSYWLVKFLCSCGSSFVSSYILSSADSKEHVYAPVFTYPTSAFSIGEAQKLEEISPNFVKIYSEVLQCEQIGLSHLVGPGLRKAIEFLIKDYLLHIGIEEDKLEKTALGACIDGFIHDEDLRAVAKATATIGNDETHWKKNNADYDLEDMKSFATVAISILSTKLEIERAKRAIIDLKAQQTNK